MLENYFVKYIAFAKHILKAQDICTYEKKTRVV